MLHLDRMIAFKGQSMNFRYLAILTALIPSFALANYAKEYQINVILNDPSSKFMSLTADKQKNATDFTVHDPNGGMTVLCPGANDDDGNPRYSFHSHTDNNTSGKIEISNNYKGDPRKSCNNISSQITDVYWVVDFGNIFYYDEHNSLRRCYLKNISLSNMSNGANTPFVKYDLLDAKNPKHGKKGIPLTAIYAHQSSEPLQTHNEQFLAAGPVDNSSEGLGIPAADNNTYACDPRVVGKPFTKVDITYKDKYVGNLSEMNDTVTLNNLAMYSNMYKHKSNFGENIIGVNLIDPGSKDYPSYQFKVINKTGNPIQLTSINKTQTSVLYCQNPKAWETEDYVFSEAADWVSAALGSAEEDSEYTIYKISDYVNKKTVDKITKDKIKNLFSICADKRPPVLLNLAESSPVIETNSSYEISQPFVLNNFDNFYNIELVYTDLNSNKNYVYSLAPTKAYKPITFNQGFHIITFEIDNSNQVKVTSEPDVPLIIENVLQGGAID